MSLKHIILLTTACMLCGAKANAVTICLNPSNGALDNNCTSDSTSSLTLNVALQAEERLKAAGYQVKMTRRDSSNPSASERVEKCKGSNFYIAIKINSASGVAKGTDIFYNANGSTLASNLKNWFNDNLKITSHRYENNASNFDPVIKSISYPGAVLYMTFIQNCGEINTIKNYQNTGMTICKAAVQTGSGSDKVKACEIPGSLSGKVTNDSGNGISGATVTVGNLGDFSKVTADANGNWKKDQLVPGSHQVQVEAPGYHSTTETCNVVSSNTNTCNVKLTASTGTLNITLTDSSNTQITGCDIITANGKTVNASGNGTWSYTNSVGSYRIEAKCKGYKDEGKDCTIKQGETNNCNLTLEKAKGKLKGSVFCNGNAVNATVNINGGGYSKTINTDDNKEWESEDLVAGQYTISVEPTDSSECKHGSGSCAVFAGETNPNCNISLSEKDKYSINILVKGYLKGYDDVKGLSPLANAKIDIALSDKHLTFSTNDAGQYEGEFTEGTYTVSVSSPLFKPNTETQKCKLIPNSNNAKPSCNLEFELIPLDRQMCISIHDKNSYSSVGGKVSFKEGPTTPKDIKIAVDTIECTGEIPIGTYKLDVTIEEEQEVNSTHSVFIPVGEGPFNYLIESDSKKQNTTTLSGNVYSIKKDEVEDEDSQGCVDAKITIVQNDDAQITESTNYKCASGKDWSIPDIPAGAYKVTATPLDDHYLTDTVSCFTGKEECNITLQYIADTPVESGESYDITSKLPEIDADSTGDCSMSQTPAHGHLWILLLNLMGLGLIARRSRRANNTHHR